MAWINDTLLLFILIVQSIVTTAVLLMLLFKGDLVQKRRKASGAAQKKIRGELRLKFKNSDFQGDLTGNLTKRILHLMEEQKIFRDPDLKLTDMASKLGISAYQNSQIIKQRFGQDFGSFINTYRVTEAIAILRQGDGPDACDVFSKVGFGNEAAFNKAFKDRTDRTPQEFIAEDMGPGH